MAGPHAEIALAARRVDAVDLSGVELTLRRDQREVELVGHGYAASAAMRSAFSTASSIEPTM